MTTNAQTRTRRRPASALMPPPFRSSLVTCLACGCDEAGEVETGKATSGSRFGDVIDGAALRRGLACFAACQCHEGDGRARRLRYELGTPRG